jgi:hypothetical protein
MLHVKYVKTNKKKPKLTTKLELIGYKKNITTKKIEININSK